MRILIVGDTHGQLEKLHRIALRAWMILGIDAIIQVGDFGFFPRVLVAYQRSCGRFPIPVHAIDGNHEDHAWLARCVTQGDADEWRERLNLHYHPRGTVSELGGAVIGWLGGAMHVDRPQEGIEEHWTQGREPPACNWIRPSDRNRAIEAWTASPPDLLVTHSCPSRLGIGMTGDPRLRPMVSAHIDALGWSTGPDGDIGEPELLTVFRRLPAARSRVHVFGHFHVFTNRVIQAGGAIQACCVGTGDGFNLERTFVYDTLKRELDIGGRLPLLRRDRVNDVRCTLAAIDASGGPVPIGLIARALGGKAGRLYQHFHRMNEAEFESIRPGTGPMAVPNACAKRFLQQVLDSDVIQQRSEP